MATSLQQGWIEGALETTYDVLEKVEIEDISFNRNIKKEEEIKDNNINTSGSNKR